MPCSASTPCCSAAAAPRPRRLQRGDALARGSRARRRGGLATRAAGLRRSPLRSAGGARRCAPRRGRRRGGVRRRLHCSRSRGSVGAGTGATIGKMLGFEPPPRAASARPASAGRRLHRGRPGRRNAAGDVVDPASGACSPAAPPRRRLRAHQRMAARARREIASGSTTLAVVATDAVLSKVEERRGRAHGTPRDWHAPSTRWTPCRRRHRVRAAPRRRRAVRRHHGGRRRGDGPGAGGPRCGRAATGSSTCRRRASCRPLGSAGSAPLGG